MKLSIIAPIFNVEMYLHHCIESLINQNISEKDYEIILVNDGSSDGSMKIANYFEKSYSNVKIINRKNGGLAAARNTGLKNASGDYVWFVDSDDWIESNCLQRLLQFAYSNRLDVLCFSGKIFKSKENVADIPSSTNHIGVVMTGDDFITNVNAIPSACMVMFRRKFLQEGSLMFYEGILHEDQEFTPRAYSLAERIAYVHENVYYYFQREGSIMKSSRNEKRCRDFLKIADSLYAFAKEHFSDNPKVLATFNYKVNFAVTQSLAFYDKKYFSLREYKNKPYYPLSINNARGAFGWKCRLINFSLPLYHFIYKCLKK